MSLSFDLERSSFPAMSVWNVVTVAQNELRSVFRLFRFWLILVLLSGATLTAYALSCMVYVNIAPFNVSFVGGTPMYLLGNLDPAYFLFFQTGLVLLMLDLQHRIRTSRLEEVIESQPIRNLEFQLGHALCFGGLVWLIACLNVLLMQLIGLVSEIFNFNFADTIQIHSMFNLLVVDAPVALMFWTSLFLLLTRLFRSRLLILVTGVVAMMGYYLWILNTPFSLVDLISHSSNQTLFISDVLPAFPSGTSWIMRLGTLLLVFAILALGAWLYRRTDSTQRVWTRVLPLASIGIGVLVLSAGVLLELHKSNEFKSWREAHLTYESSSKLDILAIHGNVQINPRRQMHIDLNVDFSVMSLSPVESLVFTLNPGYRISTIYVNESPSEFEFDNGILEISVPFVIEPETEYSLKIVAMGKPNPRFAYLNAPYDYLADTNFPVQALHSYGTEGSIFSRKFVALMPGVYWYPVPGPVPHPGDDDSLRSDFFNVELHVQLDAPPSWRVVGPGTSSPNSEEPTRYLTKPNIPIASIGLFASDFVKFAHDFQDGRIALYFHSRHAKKFLPFGRYAEEMVASFEEWLADIKAKGTSLPFQTLSFVEIPNKLRTVGGGWQMDRLNSLPGLVLMKERGFPTLNIDYVLDGAKDDYGRSEYLGNFIWGTFVEASSRALSSDNLLHGFQDQYWLHVITASGKHHNALNLIFRALSESLTYYGYDGLFSVYATAETARMTGMNFPAAFDFSRNRNSNPFDRGQLYRNEENYANRFSVRDVMERTALPALTFSFENHRSDFEAIFLKSRLIAHAVGDYLHYQGASEKIDHWLLALRREFLGKHFNYIDAMTQARDFDIDIDLLLDDWLNKHTLAGFEVSSSKTTRIANSEDGEMRYLFSFDIANTQPTAGYVLPSHAPRQIFVLPQHTSKRITTLLKRDTNETDRFFHVRAFTGLSLNREPIEFNLLKNVEIDESLEPLETLEPSDFVPKPIGIVVDDLDSGFIAHQSKPISHEFRFVPRDWFSLPVLHEEFDGTLPNIGTSGGQVPRTTWKRLNISSAYGKYRRTIALTSMTDSRKLQPVRFVADIPESGQWSLDYYLHQGFNFQLYASIANFVLEIENGSYTWSKEFYPDPSASGFKLVGEFELDAGKTDVVVVGATEPSIVYADAIRWRKKIEKE